MKPIAIHRTYEKSKAGNPDIVIHRSGAPRLKGQMQIAKWIKTLKKGDVIRTLFVHSGDQILIMICASGAKVRYANWHATGIPKGLGPQEIADRCAALDDSIFRDFAPREDIAQLRVYVDMRHALVQERTRAVNRVRGIARSLGMVKECDYDDAMSRQLAIAQKVEASVEGKTVNWVTDIEKKIASVAQGIKECVTFNEITHIGDSWGTSATVVALTGGVDRFSRVASLWHYSGEHVVNGKAPKRTAGQASDWNARLRSTLWQMSDSIVKNRDNPWRTFYDQVKAEELAAHASKCKCKFPDGHAHGRAQRKMRKEILKRFFLACQSVPFDKNHHGGHVDCETHTESAVAAD